MHMGLADIFGNTSHPFFLLVVMILRVFTNAHAHRLAKEQKLYAQENQDQKLKVDKLVANNADEWDIKNGVRPHTRTSPSITGPFMSAYPILRTPGPPFVLIVSC